MIIINHIILIYTTYSNTLYILLLCILLIYILLLCNFIQIS